MQNIKSTGYGSDRFGCCECCGKKADVIFVRNNTETIELFGEEITVEKGSLYGHRECLENANT